MFTKFVIVGQPRSGSWLTLTSLAQHPQILCLGEVFNRAQAGMIREHRAFLHYVERYWVLDSPVMPYFEDVLFQPADGKQAIGCKIDYNQAFTEDETAGAIRAYLDTHRDVRILHQYRRSHLASLISWKKAQETGIWRRFAGERRSLPRRVVIEPEEFAAYVERVRRHRAAARAFAATHPCLEIAYEAIVEDFAGSLRAMHAFLGVTPCGEVRRLTQKQESQPPREAVANYEALLAALAGSRLLDDLT